MEEGKYYTKEDIEKIVEIAVKGTLDYLGIKVNVPENE